MSDEIIKVLDNIGEKVGITIDWTSQNILPYLQDLMHRFISLQNAKAIAWIIILSISVIIAIISLIVLTKKFKKEKYDGLISLTILLGVSILICLVIPLICNIFGLFQNIYTPEITLLEYITNYGGI